jgi:hypothetical protein
MSHGAMSLEEAVRARLGESAGLVEPSDLVAHLARDAVFVVDPCLTLVDCGVAIALDDVPTVTRWLEASLLRKPTASEREAWPRVAELRLVAIVVQPFVLVQLPLE